MKYTIPVFKNEHLPRPLELEHLNKHGFCTMNDGDRTVVDLLYLLVFKFCSDLLICEDSESLLPF